MLLLLRLVESSLVFILGEPCSPVHQAGCTCLSRAQPRVSVNLSVAQSRKVWVGAEHAGTRCGRVDRGRHSADLRRGRCPRCSTAAGCSGRFWRALTSVAMFKHACWTLTASSVHGRLWPSLPHEACLMRFRSGIQDALSAVAVLITASLARHPHSSLLRLLIEPCPCQNRCKEVISSVVWLTCAQAYIQV